MAEKKQRRTRLRAGTRGLLSLVGCLAVYYALPYGRHGASVTGTVGLMVFAAGAAILAALIIRQVGHHLIYGGERGDEIQSLMLVLCLVVVGFSLIYLKMEDQFEDLHTKTDSLYFTVATLATVGYGDVHPVGQTARAVVTFQMALDLVLVATLFSVASGLLRNRAASRRAAAQATPES